MKKLLLKLTYNMKTITIILSMMLCWKTGIVETVDRLEKYS